MSADRVPEYVIRNAREAALAAVRNAEEAASAYLRQSAALRNAKKAADLRRFARDGNVENFRLALRLLTRQDVYETDDDGWTALMYAAQNGHLEIVRIIVDNFDVDDSINADGFTALMLAVENNYYMVVDKLLRAGADINAGRGNSAVILASEAGYVDVLNLLFESQTVDLNKVGKDGYTALMFAAQNGHIEVVQKLIEKGADVNVIGSAGENAIDLAALNRYYEIVDLLYEQGAKMSLRVFTIACYNISLLLNHEGASVYAGNLSDERNRDLDFIEKTIERDPDMDIGREYDDPEFGGTHGDDMHYDVRCAFAEIWHVKNLRDEFRFLTPATLGTTLIEQPLPDDLPAEGKYFTEIGVEGFDANNVDTELANDANVKALYYSGSCLLVNVPDDIKSFVTTPNLVVYQCGDNFKQPQGYPLIKLTFPNGASVYVNRNDLVRLSMSPHRKFLCQVIDSDRIFSRYVTGSCPNITSVSHCDVLDQTLHPIALIIALVPASEEKTPARGVKRRMSTPASESRKSPRGARGARGARRRLMPSNGGELAGGKLYGGFFHQLGRQIQGGNMSTAEKDDLMRRMKMQYKLLRGY